jgi:DNA-binding transcriptional ArsR family regulator
MSQRLKVFQLNGQNTNLAGSIPGRNLLAKLIKSVTSPSTPRPVFLDFSGVETATASYLRESVMRFRDYCLRSRLPLYAVVANAHPDVIEELEIVLAAENDAILACSLSTENDATAVRILGLLDHTQRLTLDEVFKRGEVDAITLSQTSNEVGSTAWNNRLVALAGKGLVIEEKKGRGKYYRPVVELK